MLANSTFKYGMEGWTVGSGAVAEAGWTGTDGYFVKFHTKANGDISNNRIFQDKFAVGGNHKPGETYTLSFMAKSPEGASIRGGYVYSLCDFQIGTEWARYSVTYKVPEGGKTGSLTFYPVLKDVEIYLSQVKLEYGNKATDWTPAAEDLEGKVDGLDEKLEGAISDLAENINFVEQISKDLEAVKNQADGAIESWFFDPVPTLDNEPAVGWTDEKTRNVHLGDLYYDGEGRSYRFQLKDGVYSWNPIKDSDIAKALADAKRAQDTADGKRRVFVKQPTNAQAYDVGDLWVNATYGDTYVNDLLRCKTAKAANAAFSIGHWELASKYTDDTKANQAIEDAAEAKAAADGAQSDATEAKNRLDRWASDGYISPAEKQGIRDEKVRVDAEKEQVNASYSKYSLGTPTGYNAAWTKYSAQLTSLSAASPENIAIPSDFSANQQAYYSERTDALNAIADASKKYADDLVDGIEVGGRNLIKNSNFILGDGLEGWIGYVEGGKLEVVPGENGRNILKISRSGYTGSNRCGVYQTLVGVNLKKGTYYTLSAKVKGKNLDGSNNQFFIREIGTSNTITRDICAYKFGNSDDFVEVKATSQLDSDEVKRIDAYVLIHKNGEAEVCDFKLEYGTVATSWTPAIEDVNGMIEDAQQAADDAAEAAKNAQADATNANKELTNIKSDNLISPIEKTALKQQQADMVAEYGEVTANATRYSVSTTAYKSAYDKASAALVKYTASSPEYITVGSDYTDISAYYAARKTILDAIAAAAKKAADDALNKANQAVEDAARAGHYLLDLDNDSGQVVCDADGNVTGGYPTTNAKVWYGTTPDTGWSFNGAFIGCTGSVNASSGAVSVTGVSKDDASVTITATKSGKPELSAVFTIVKVRSGRDGEDGEAGNGIKSITNKYAVSASNTTAPTSWSDTVPTMTTTNRYLWNYEIVTYTNGSTSETKKRVIGVYGDKGNTGPTGSPGKDGADGVGIKSITEYYLASSASSGVTVSTSGWTTSVQATSSSKKYLWNYEVVTYTNDTKYTSSPVIIGTHGDSGAVAKQITGVTDLNKMLGAEYEGRWYAVGSNGIANKPSGVDAFGLDVYRTASGYYTQLLTPGNTGTNKLWIRTANNGAWSAWVEKGKDGANGAPGAPGANGKTSYLHIAYANDTTGGGFSVSDSTNKLYIGQYTDFTVEDSTDYKKYSWTRIKGDKGDTGPTGSQGIPGTSSYFHVKYSSNPDGNPMTDTPNTYIGTAVTTSPTPPSSYTSYKWTQFKGSQGAKGEQGIPGTNGADGKTSYLHIKYSNDGGKTFTANNGETPGSYLGQYVDFTEADSGSVSAYAWSKIKGETGPQGVPGTPGKDGTPRYTWIRYADNASGSGISNSPTGKTYIGFAYNKTTATESNTPSDYTWSKFKGDDGADGKGIKSTAVTYQASTSGNTPPTGTWSATVPSVAANQYLWTRTVITYTDNTSSTSYSVGKMGATGAAGPQGKPGADGDGIVSVSNTYQIGSSGTTAPTGSWSATVPSPQKGKYLWTKTVTTYKKSDPTTVYSVSYYGTDGAAAKYVRVSGDQVFAYSNNFTGNPTPTSITLTATLTGTSGYQWSYKQAGQTSFTNISGATSQTYALAHNNSTVWGSAKSVTLRCTSGGVHDEMTVVKVSSGATGATGSPGKDGADGSPGKNGADAYTVILGNESHSFPGTTGAAVASSARCDVIAYKGATKVAATIGTPTGMPSGMSHAVSGNGTTSAYVTFSVTASMTTGSGVVNVPVTVDGKVFTKQFSYSIAFKGATGATGGKGDKGDAAVTYYLVPSVSVVKKSMAGVLDPATVTCKKFKSTGSASIVETTEKTLKYQRVGQDSSAQNYTGAVAVTASTTMVVFSLYDGSKEIDRENVHVVEDAGDLEVGGRNYAQGTANEKKITSVDYQSNEAVTLGYTTTGLKKGDKVVVSFDYEAKDIVFEEGKSNIAIQFNEYYGYAHIYSSIKENGKSHCVSSIITLNNYYNSSDPVVETFKSTPFIRFDYIKINSGGYFRVWNFMVNKGTVEADWSPAPEDLATKVDFQLLEDSIESKVSKTDFDSLSGKVTQQGTTIQQHSNQISSTATQVSSLGTRVSKVEQTATEITSTVEGINGEVSKLKQTDSSLTSQISTANGKISTLEQTASRILAFGLTTFFLMVALKMVGFLIGTCPIALFR